jgi:hypothetical protein
VVDRPVAGVPGRLLRLLAQALLAATPEVGGAPLQVRLLAIRLLPEAVERAQGMPYVAPHRGVERERVAQHAGVVADPDDGAGPGEAQVAG